MEGRNIYMVLGAMMLLSSCKDEGVAPIPEEGLSMVPVSFTIRLNTDGKATRGEEPGIWTPGKDEHNNDLPEGENKTENGTDFDNRINTVTPVLYYTSYDGSSRTIEPSSPVATLIGTETIEFDPEKTMLSKIIEADGSFKGRYRVSTEMICSYATRDMLLDSDNLRLSLFINCSTRDIASGMNIRNPKDVVFFHHGQPDDVQDNDLTTYRHFHGIPMYGVCDVKFARKSEEGEDVIKVFDAGKEGEEELDIPVLRSMAKVRVRLNKDDEGNLDLWGKTVSLKELYISRHTVKGYVVPKGWDTRPSMLDVYNNGLAMNPVAGSGSGHTDYPDNYDHGCTVAPQPDDDDRIGDAHKGENYDGDYHANTNELLRFYLPDTFNFHNDGDDRSEEIYLRITYNIGGVYEEDGVTLKDFSHILWFRKAEEWIGKYDKALDDGTPSASPPKDTTPWDIIRNHIYEFVIEGVEENGSLKISTCVLPWKYRTITGLEL